MPKNNIFESIENNEIVKNLVDDSKKIFDEFLGFVGPRFPTHHNFIFPTTSFEQL